MTEEMMMPSREEIHVRIDEYARAVRTRDAHLTYLRKLTKPENSWMMGHSREIGFNMMAVFSKCTMVWQTVYMNTIAFDCLTGTQKEHIEIHLRGYP